MLSEVIFSRSNHGTFSIHWNLIYLIKNFSITRFLAKDLHVRRSCAIFSVPKSNAPCQKLRILRGKFTIFGRCNQICWSNHMKIKTYIGAFHRRELKNFSGPEYHTSGPPVKDCSSWHPIRMHVIFSPISNSMHQFQK